MKGMELPVNMIVIVMVAVLVILAVAFYFTQQSGRGVSAIDLEKAYQQGCIVLKAPAFACDHNKINTVPTGYSAGGTAYSLGNVCALRGIRDSVSCAKSCGCDASGTALQLSAPQQTSQSAQEQHPARLESSSVYGVDILAP